MTNALLDPSQNVPQPSTGSVSPSLSQNVPPAVPPELVQRALDRPVPLFYSEGVKQKNLLEMRRVIQALRVLCNQYEAPAASPLPDVSSDPSQRAASQAAENLSGPLPPDPRARQARDLLKAYSQLAFNLAYCEPDLFVGHAGFLAFPFPKEDGTVGNYHLDEVIDFGGGTKAFGFKGSNRNDPPLLVFHGTLLSSPYSSGAGRTVIADLDPCGVGRKHYDWNQQAIEKWLKKTTQGGQNKAIVTGHSLGGSFATYAGVYLPQYVKKAVAFYTPTVDSDTHAAYHGLQVKPDIQTYHNPGDRISEFGDGFKVGSHYNIETSHPQYQGVHSESLFLVDETCRWTLQQDIESSNQMAASYKETFFRGVRKLGKCFPLIFAIGVVAAKKFFIGSRNSSVCLLRMLYMWIYGWFLVLKSCVTDTGSFSSAAYLKIDAFLRIAHRDRISVAWEKFIRGEFSLKEFSAVYLVDTLQADFHNPANSLVPLKIRLIQEVIRKTLKNHPTFISHLDSFCETTKQEASLYYLYHQMDFIRDFEAYLQHLAVPIDGAAQTAIQTCKRHVKTIQEFEIFEGEESLDGVSEFQRGILCLAQRSLPSVGRANG